MLLGRPSRRIAAFQIGICFDQQVHNRQCAIHTGDEQRSPRIGVFREVRLSFLIAGTIQQNTGTLVVVETGRHVESGLTLLILVVDIDASIDQQLHDIDKVGLGGHCQHCAGLGYLFADGSALCIVLTLPVLSLEQRPGGQRVATHDTKVQGRPPIMVLPSNAIDTTTHVKHVPGLQVLDNNLANGLEAILSAVVQRGAAGDILGQQGAALVRVQLVKQVLQ